MSVMLAPPPALLADLDGTGTLRRLFDLEDVNRRITVLEETIKERQRSSGGRPPAQDTLTSLKLKLEALEREYGIEPPGIKAEDKEDSPASKIG